MIKHFTIILMLSVASCVFAGYDYDVTPPGTDSIISGFGDAQPVYDSVLFYGDYRLRITTNVARYIVDRENDTIFCSQRLGGPERKNLTIAYETDLLQGMQRDSTTPGYQRLSNGNIKIAFLSDGTMWVHVVKPGTEIRIISNITRDYDKGGGKFEFDTTGSTTANTWPISSKRIVRTNWLVITDDGATDKVACTGGFGVYCRPSTEGGGSWAKC